MNAVPTLTWDSVLFLEWGTTPRILGAAVAGLVLLALARPLVESARSWQRGRALAAWVRRQGGSFRSRGDPKLVARLAAMDPLGDSAVSPDIRHVLELSSPGSRTLIFDHELWVEGHSRPLLHTAVLVEDQDLRLPRFEMHPFYPGGGVELDEAPLVARYRMRTHPDERRPAREVFDRLLAGFGDHAGWSVAVGGSRLLLFQAGYRPDPGQMSDLVETARVIHGLVRAAALSGDARSP